MTDFVRLPTIALVEPPEVESLRKKFAAAQANLADAEAQKLAAHQRFWDYVQSRRKPIGCDELETRPIG